MLLTSAKLAEFEKIDRDLRFLLGCFQEVLEELEEEGLARCLPWIETESQLDTTAHPTRIAQVHSIAFLLLNMVQENAMTQYRRVLESDQGTVQLPGLWGQTLQHLKQAGMSEQRITRRAVGAEGKARKRRPGGRSARPKGKTDWKRLATMKEAELLARARQDRDAKPV